MRAIGDNSGAIKELRKAKMSNDYYNTSDKNKIFIDYCLAYHYYRDEQYELSNIYLSNICDKFNEDVKNREDMKLEYCNYLWLNVNVNYNSMDIESIVNNMTVVYNYYLDLKECDVAVSALENIFRFKGDSEKVLECLSELMKSKYISDWNFVDSILRDCSDISYNLYIKALNIVNSYKLKIDTV